MKISAKIDYACRALLELSMHWPSNVPLQVGEIARKQKIPTKFLIHILISLKEAGYVESVRGKKGGYILAKAPEDIKLSRVIHNFGGMTDSLLVDDKKKVNTHVMDLTWRDIRRSIYGLVDQINFGLICEREKSKSRVVDFEI